MAQLHTERVKGEVLKPTATLALIERIGVTRAARAIGTSTTTLHKARKPNAVVSRVIEVAASAALSDEVTAPGGPVHNRRIAPPELTNSKPHVAKLQIVAAPEPVLMLLEVPADKARIVERLCKALGAKFVEA